MRNLSKPLIALSSILLLVDVAFARPESFLEAFKSDAYVSITDITGDLVSKVPEENLFKIKAKNAEGLRRHYSLLSSAFRSHYPQQHARAQINQILHSYTGVKEFSFMEVHRYPFLPISVTVLDPASYKISKMTIRYNAREYDGMRVEGEVAKQYQQSLVRLIAEYGYLPTLNARALGYRYARIIPELSENVRPASKFVYNGFLEWDQHQSNEKDAQMLRPIELTNFAHVISGTYVISQHPDFAVEPENVNKPVTMTFFLWDHKPGANDLPDFVYQILVRGWRR